MLGPASSRLEIPEPVPDNPEPVLENLSQALERADDSIDSDDRDYKGQSQESQDSQESQGSQECQEMNELEQHGDDEGQFAHWGGALRLIGHEVRNSQAPIVTITPENTRSSSRIGYPGRRTLALVHICHHRYPSVVLSHCPAVLNFACNTGHSSKPPRANNTRIGEWRWRADLQQTEYGQRD